MDNEKDAISLELIIEADFFQEQEIHEKDHDAAPVENLHGEYLWMTNSKK